MGVGIAILLNAERATATAEKLNPSFALCLGVPVALLKVAELLLPNTTLSPLFLIPDLYLMEASEAIYKKVAHTNSFHEKVMAFARGTSSLVANLSDLEETDREKTFLPVGQDT